MMLVLRSFKVTQGQKLASKGQKGQISIFIKSSWNLHEKEALNVSFSVKLVKVIQGPTGQKLTDKGQKGQIFGIRKNRIGLRTSENSSGPMGARLFLAEF